MAVAASVKIEGLDEAMKALRAAFPKDMEAQRRVLNATMRGAATKTIVKMAKVLAYDGDSSGALSESIGIRNQPKRALKTARKAGGVYIAPIRHNAKAIAKYIQYYYNRHGNSAPASVVASGIRHGHLVEFGVPSRGIPANSFLGAAADSQLSPYEDLFAMSLKQKVENAVRREAKKRGKK